MDGAEAKTLRIIGRYSRIRISILYIQSSRQRASKKGEDNSYYRNYENKSVCIDENVPFEIPDNWEL